MVTVVRDSTLFSMSSIAMILLNKGCVLLFPHPSVLLIFQNVCTILILSFMGEERMPFEIGLWIQWFPCSLLFCVNLFSSLQSLVYISVPTFTVLRNLQPILAVGIDFIVRGEKQSCFRVNFLVQVLIGAVLYCSHDLDFEPRGYFWAILHCVSMTFYSVLVKFKSDELGLSAKNMSWFNNIMSIPGLLTIMAFEHTIELGSRADNLNSRTFDDCMRCAHNPLCTFTILSSCAGGFFVSVTGFQAQKVMSPTSWLSLNNFSKIPAILISFILFGGFISSATVHGMIISITAAYLYALSGRQSITVFSHLVAFCITSSSIFWVFSDSSLAYMTFQSPTSVFFPGATSRIKTVFDTEDHSHLSHVNRTMKSPFVSLVAYTESLSQQGTSASKQGNISTLHHFETNASKESNVSTLHHFETNATLVIIFGTPRGGNLAWETMRRHVLHSMNASLAILFPCRNGSVRVSLEDIAEYNWCYNEPSDWALYYDDIHARCPNRNESNWRTNYCRKDLQDYELSFLGGLYSCLADSNLGRQKRGSGAIAVVMRWLALQKIKEFNLDKKYAHLIFSRADYLYLHPPLHPRILNEPGIVYVPDGEGYGGYCDRYIAGSMQTMIKALGWADEVVCHSARYKGVANPEQVLKFVLTRHGIRPVTFGFTMFAVRAPQDPSSWSLGVDNHVMQKFNLKVKYVYELSSSLRNSQVDLESYLLQIQREMRIL